MEKIKELLKNKKVIIGLVAVLGIATVGTVFALNQQQPTKETVSQEMRDEEHAKLMTSIKSMQEADAQAKLKAEAEKKAAEEKAKAEAEQKAKEEAEKKAAEEAQQSTTTTTSNNENNNSNNTAVASNNTTSAPSKPATPTVAPKPQTKPQPVPAPKPKPVERKRLGSLGNSGLEFKTYDDLKAYIAVNYDSDDGLDKLEAKLGYEVIGWSGWTVDYSDGSQTWTIQWKKR